IGRLLRPEEDEQAGGDRQGDDQQGADLPPELHLLQLDHRQRRLLGGLLAVDRVPGKGHCHRASVPGHSGMFMTSWYACTSRLRTSTVARKATCDCCEATITRARSAPGSPRSNAACSAPAFAWVAFTPSIARDRVWVKLGTPETPPAPGACIPPRPWIASPRATSPVRAAAWPSWPGPGARPRKTPTAGGGGACQGPAARGAGVLSPAPRGGPARPRTRAASPPGWYGAGPAAGRHGRPRPRCAPAPPGSGAAGSGRC